jgi:hypothetical protein
MSPPVSQPSQRWRKRKRTPDPPSRCNQARNSGEVLSDFGNTRPLVPTKVSCPRSSDHWRKAAGGNASIAGRKRGAADP